jgi:hypothetical protein
VVKLLLQYDESVMPELEMLDSPLLQAQLAASRNFLVKKLRCWN